jgi:hypothetical protein
MNHALPVAVVVLGLGLVLFLMVPLAGAAVSNTKEIKRLLTEGLSGEAEVLGYELRRSGKVSMHFVKFRFTPHGQPAPLTFEKVVKNALRLPAGSTTSIRYSERFPFLSVIVAHGLHQEASSGAVKAEITS